MNAKTQEVINEVLDKWGEWIEEAQDKCPDAVPSMVIEILASMLVKEREKNQYLSLMAYRK